MSTASLLSHYQQPLVGRIEGALRHCLVAAGVLGLVALALVFLAPAPPVHEMALDEMPERYAKLILEKPAPPVPAPVMHAPSARIELPEAAPAPTPAVEVAARPEPVVQPKPRPQRRTTPREKPQVAPDRGVQGRQRAQTEVTQNLTKVASALDKSLEDLAQVLPAAGAGDEDSRRKPAQRRRRGTRGGRTSGQLAAVAGMSDLPAADLGGSALATEAVAIAAIDDLAHDGGGSTGGGGEGRGSAGFSGRSNESLLAVVRRYAPGIQFCYENELKRDAGLRGKLVVSLTVAAGGRVTDVTVVEDTLGSEAVTGCAVEQMRGWVFPPVDGGTSTFKAPFVFTPPDGR